MKRTTRKPRSLGFESLEGREMMAAWGPADLYGSYLNAPSSAEWGQDINVTARIRNAASFGSAAFDVQWFLSMDAAGSPGDIPLLLANGSEMHQHGSLGPNSYGSQFTVSLMLPEVVPVGLAGKQFHLVMKTDASSEIIEFNELNNFGQRGLNQDRDTITISMPAAATAFADASQDATPTRVFNDGALRLKFNPAQYGTRSNPLTSFTVEALRSGRVMATWTKLGTDPLLNLDGRNLAGGDYLFRVQGNFKLTGTQTLAQTTITLQQSALVEGTYLAETVDYTSGGRTYGWAFDGRGGTDTLRLNVLSSAVTGLNGRPLSELATAGPAVRQAIYQGTAWDFLELSDGREVYFQGIERLEFSNGYTRELLVKPNDPEFAHQWNLHIQDVPTAWRFTQGSGDVLLVSLDTGVLPTLIYPNHTVVDQDLDRLITDEYDDQGFTGASYSHGHMAISVMAGAANNGVGVAGINWNSEILVMDVYNGDEGSLGLADPYVSFITHLEQALDFARASGRRVVFQGGIQGESWLNGTNYTQQDLQNFFTANQDIALFAVAAGNGDEDIEDATPLDYGTSGGVARLASVHGNLIAVGAAFPNASGNYQADHELTSVAGLDNALAINRASYSNYGRSLTLMAPTNSPAARNDGTIDSFGGTSCANPNMAGVASLLWSVLPNYEAAQIRQILVHTATDLFDPGHDADTGFGLVNADAAVRRAMALARDPQLALLGMPMTPVTFPDPYLTSPPSSGGSYELAPSVPSATTSPSSLEADQLFADEQFLANLAIPALEGDEPLATATPVEFTPHAPVARQVLARVLSLADTSVNKTDAESRIARKLADAALSDDGAAAYGLDELSLLDPQMVRAIV